jgi:hypothetical protein
VQGLSAEADKVDKAAGQGQELAVDVEAVLNSYQQVRVRVAGRCEGVRAAGRCAAPTWCPVSQRLTVCVAAKLGVPEVLLIVKLSALPTPASSRNSVLHVLHLHP